MFIQLCVIIEAVKLDVVATDYCVKISSEHEKLGGLRLYLCGRQVDSIGRNNSIRTAMKQFGLLSTKNQFWTLKM